MPKRYLRSLIFIAVGVGGGISLYRITGIPAFLALFSVPIVEVARNTGFAQAMALNVVILLSSVLIMPASDPQLRTQQLLGSLISCTLRPQ